MRSLYVVLALVASGCATASPEQPGTGGRPDGGMAKDSGMVIPVDAAPLPDAPPGQMTVTLSQTNNQTLSPQTSVACPAKFFGTTVATSENSWFRVFSLADHGITGPFNLQRVSFMVEYSYAGSSATQPATIKVGTYTGTLEANTLDMSKITPVTSKPIEIPDLDADVAVPPPIEVDVPATIPAGSNLVVEVALPDGFDDGNYFYIGVSNGGESKKGYLRAPLDCDIQAPTSLVSGLSAPSNSILLTVSGTH